MSVVDDEEFDDGLDMSEDEYDDWSTLGTRKVEPETNEKAYLQEFSAKGILSSLQVPDELLNEELRKSLASFQDPETGAETVGDAEGVQSAPAIPRLQELGRTDSMDSLQYDSSAVNDAFEHVVQLYRTVPEDQALRSSRLGAVLVPVRP